MKGVLKRMSVLALLAALVLCGNLQIGAGKQESPNFTEQFRKALMNSDAESPKIDVLIDVKSDTIT
jgi:hypothetical protein